MPGSRRSRCTPGRPRSSTGQPRLPPRPRAPARPHRRTPWSFRVGSTAPCCGRGGIPRLRRGGGHDRARGAGQPVDLRRADGSRVRARRGREEVVGELLLGDRPRRGAPRVRACVRRPASSTPGIWSASAFRGAPTSRSSARRRWARRGAWWPRSPGAGPSTHRTLRRAPSRRRWPPSATSESPRLGRVARSRRIVPPLARGRAPAMEPGPGVFRRGARPPRGGHGVVTRLGRGLSELEPGIADHLEFGVENLLEYF